LAALPPALQAELFDVFDIQIIWNAPMRQATFRATITDTTPGIITALFARASNDPGHLTKVWPPDSPAIPATSHPTRANATPAPLQGSIHIPILPKSLPVVASSRWGNASGNRGRAASRSTAVT
jgi:hypothetical protein